MTLTSTVEGNSVNPHARENLVIRLRAALATASVLLVAFLATACGGGSSSTSAGGLTTVKVTVIPIVDVAPVYLGNQMGFFKGQGIDLRLNTAQGGAAIVPAVVSGQIDFGFSNLTSLIIGTSKGLPLQVVSAGDASTGVQAKDFGSVIVPGNSPIKSAKDLAGKRIAVNTLNNINDTTVRASIRAVGGDPSNVEFVELGFPDMLAALAKGNVDAAQVVEPFQTIGTQQGDRIVASNYVDTAPQLAVGVYFTSQQTLKSKPDLVKKFEAAMQQSQQYAAAHPDAVRQILGSYTKIDPAVEKSLVLPLFPTHVDNNSVQVLSQLALRDGLITKIPAPQALVQ